MLTSAIYSDEQKSIILTEQDQREIIYQIEGLEKALDGIKKEYDLLLADYKSIKTNQERKEVLVAENTVDQGAIYISQFKIQKRVLLVVDLFNTLTAIVGGGLVFVGMSQNNESLAIVGTTISIVSLASTPISYGIISLKFKF